MPKIVPTVGRKVYFNPGHPSMIGAILTSILPARFAINGVGPFDATIANVNEDGTVNLGIRDHDGFPHAAQDIPLWDGSGDRPDASTAFAEWMPYQLGQAAEVSATLSGVSSLTASAVVIKAPVAEQDPSSSDLASENALTTNQPAA